MLSLIDNYNNNIFIPSKFSGDHERMDLKNDGKIVLFHD